MRNTHLPTHLLRLPQAIKKHEVPNLLLNQGQSNHLVNAATASGSSSQGEIGLESHDHQASSDESNSSESTPTLREDVSAPVVDKPNMRCVDVQQQAYRDAKMLN